MIGLVLLIVLVTDFNSRMAELTRLREQKENEMRNVEHLLVTQSALATKINFAESDKAVEAWAREQERSVLPGDFPVIPMVAPDYQTPEDNDSEQLEISLSHWENWIVWLFGTTGEDLP